MVRGKRFGIVVIVSVMVLQILTPVAWAQNPAPVGESSEGQKAAAGMANIVYIPAKVLFCIGSGVSWLGALILSGGTAYYGATNAVRAGCGGKWALTGEDIQPNAPVGAM